MFLKMGWSLQDFFRKTLYYLAVTYFGYKANELLEGDSKPQTVILGPEVYAQVPREENLAAPVIIFVVVGIVLLIALTAVCCAYAVKLCCRLIPTINSPQEIIPMYERPRARKTTRRANTATTVTSTKRSNENEEVEESN